MAVPKCPGDLKLLSDETSIGDVVRDVVRTGPHEEPVHVLDLDDVVRKHCVWRAQMPRVAPFYAVKCNDDPRILQTLVTLGVGFDCASQGELERMLDFGVPPERIIYAHPAKSIPSLQNARARHVSLMTFDSAAELEKIHRQYPAARLVLRMRHDALKARCMLGKKFGCDPVRDAPPLLRQAAALCMNVVGISFHVGSNCDDHEVFFDAVRVARGLFDCARTVGYELSLLDVGGGFPGDRSKPIDRYAEAVNRAIDHFFPAEANVRIIAEPGRYYVSSAVTLVSFVNCKRPVTERLEDGSERTRMYYYLNDGIFGTFLSTVIDAQEVFPVVQRKAGVREFPSSVWGPTCNAVDLILPDILLPELEVGDSLVFENVGAYCAVLSCRFNGFPLPKVLAYLREGTWKILNDSTGASSEASLKEIFAPSLEVKAT